MKKVFSSLTAILLFFCLSLARAQSSPDYNGGLKIKFDENGKKYLRFISWGQVQAAYDANANDDQSAINFNLRRARILLYSQINKKFLILTHFGLNNLNDNSLSPTGKGEGSQLFMHDAWIQYNVNKHLSIGGGLHTFNGISRLNNQSTLNMLTMDNHRQSWATLGLSDQFVRHVGIFAKGNLGKLQYRLAINDAITNGLDDRQPMINEAVYAGRRLLGSKDAGKIYAGYFDYHFFDQESNFLPFKVGTYLGEKKVFNLGAGFFYHPKGSVRLNDLNNPIGDDVALFAIDAFYDAPLAANGSALTLYATFQSNDYGKNYLYSAYGTGNMIYGHAGYLFAGNKDKTRYQPYISYGINHYDAISDNYNVLGIGINAYLSGNNSKLTLEYKNQDYGNANPIGQNKNLITLQAMIYL